MLLMLDVEAGRVLPAGCNGTFKELVEHKLEKVMDYSSLGGSYIAVIDKDMNTVYISDPYLTREAWAEDCDDLELVLPKGKSGKRRCWCFQGHLIALRM